MGVIRPLITVYSCDNLVMTTEHSWVNTVVGVVASVFASQGGL